MSTTPDDPRWDEAASALEELRELTTCRCDPAWTDRKLHDPRCLIDWREDVETLAGLLLTPQMAEVLQAAKAWRDEHGFADRSCAPSHRLLVAAVDAWEASREH